VSGFEDLGLCKSVEPKGLALAYGGQNHGVQFEGWRENEIKTFKICAFKSRRQSRTGVKNQRFMLSIL